MDDARLEHPLIDAREGLTILGNLIDNALDAAATGERRPPLVRVFLADDAGRRSHRRPPDVSAETPAPRPFRSSLHAKR